MDVFLVDLETIEDNATFQNLMTDAVALANNRPHILSLEDVERCKLFNGRAGWDNSLSMSTFLGILDGIIENTGRIIFLTVNDLTPLQVGSFFLTAQISECES